MTEQKEPTPRRRSTDVWILRPVILSFLLLTLLFFITLTGFALALKANNNRIKDIQASRTASCRETYDGIREVFKPFFPTPPRTPQQVDDIAKFNGTIDRLKQRCIIQTKP